MRLIHRFLDSVQWLGTHRVLGLPLRMVLTSDWHRVHAWVIALGFGLMVIGEILKWHILKPLGMIVALPSLLCFFLLPLAIGILLLLGWISDYRGEFRGTAATTPHGHGSD